MQVSTPDYFANEKENKKRDNDGKKKVETIRNEERNRTAQKS